MSAGDRYYVMIGSIHTYKVPATSSYNYNNKILYKGDIVTELDYPKGVRKVEGLIYCHIAPKTPGTSSDKFYVHVSAKQEGTNIPHAKLIHSYTVTGSSAIGRKERTSSGPIAKVLLKGNEIQSVNLVLDKDTKIVYIKNIDDGYWYATTVNGNRVLTHVPGKEVSWSKHVTVAEEEKAFITGEYEDPNYESESKQLSKVQASSGYMPEPWFTNHSSTAGNYDNRDYGDTIKNINAIHGVPYQFLPNADKRFSSDGAAIGRVYANKIVSKMPVLFITPGRPNFMTNYTEQEKKSFLEGLMSYVAGDQVSSLEGVLSKPGRYYTFQFDHVRYFNYVNPMCRIAAQYLGVGDVKLLDNIALKSYNWGDGSVAGVAKTPAFLKYKLQSFFQTGLPGNLAFYLNSDTSISESFSNNTTESMLAGKANSISDIGREMNFLLGYSTAATGVDLNGTIFDSFQDTDISSSIENITDAIGSVLGSNNFITNLASHLSTVSKGGKLTFPEIWSDSSFSRSYDVNIKLVSPDSDKLSVYLNVIVPLLHLIGLVAPQSVNANPNGYLSPFLIRAVYKGLFNIDMGIITSMSVTKGAECGWTKEGIPTVVDVSFTIKDLYEALSITDMQGSSEYDTMNNTAQMDYIANLCGINIFKPETSRQIEMWFVQNGKNRALDALYNIYGNIEQRTMNKMMQIYQNSRFL